MTTRVEISKRLFLINSASTIAVQIIRVTVLLWLHQHLLRRVSPQEYVLYPIVLAIVAFIPVFAGILTSGLGRYVVEAYAQDDEARIVEIVSTMFTLLLPLGLVLMLVGALASWHVDKLLTIAPDRVWDARLMLFLLVLPLAVQLPLAPFVLGTFVRQKYVLANTITLASEVLRSVVLFGLLLTVSTRVLWVPVATVCGQTCAIVATVIVSRRLVPSLRFRRDAVQWSRVREMVTFGGWNFLASAAVRIQQSVVPLMLNEFGAALDVACFHAGTMGHRQLSHWLEVTSKPLYPIVTGMHAIGAKHRLRSVYIRGGRVNLWVAGFAAVPAMIYARELMHLYVGPAYSDGAHVLALTLAGLLLSGGSSMIWKLSVAMARVRTLSIFIFISQATLLGTTFLLVGWLGLGAVGAALGAFVVGAASSVFLMWPLGLRLADVEPRRWIEETLVPGLMPTCVAGVAWSVLRIMVGPTSWLSLGGCIAAGWLVYILVLLRFSMVPIDRSDLMRILAKAGPLARLGRLACGGAQDGN